MGIENIHIKQIIILKSLLETRNVSETAKIMSTSQSTISHVLKKLRHELNDELFIIHGRNIVPTVKAVEMYDFLYSSVEILKDFKKSESYFNPNKNSYEYQILISQTYDSIYSSRIINSTAKYSNLVFQFHILTETDNLHEKISKYKPDILLGFSGPIKNCKKEPLTPIEYKVLHSKKIKISNNNFIKLTHIRMADNDFYINNNNLKIIDSYQLYNVINI